MKNRFFQSVNSRKSYNLDGMCGGSPSGPLAWLSACTALMSSSMVFRTASNISPRHFTTGSLPDILAYAQLSARLSCGKSRGCSQALNSFSDIDAVNAKRSPAYLYGFTRRSRIVPPRGGSGTKNRRSGIGNSQTDRDE